MSERLPIRWWLCAILIASALLRATLVFGGGQFYWPDEGRYETSRALVSWLATGDAGDLFDQLNRADHVLFKFVGMIPAAAEHAAGESSRIPALFFSAFSVLNIWLLWRIARRLGAGEPESLAAAGLLAASTALLYYARHVLPYDLAMTFGLMAMHTGLRMPSRLSRSFAVGVLAACAFLTYAGYWTLTAAALLVHVAHQPGPWRRSAARAAAAGAGAAAPIAAAVLVSTAFGGRLFDSFVGFAQTVTQGVYAEGWRLPFEYLWHAEHLLLLLWMAALASALWHARRGGLSPHVRTGLLGVAVIYGAFVMASVVLEQFVVYGRLARQLVPFLCLVAAAELERLRASASPLRRILVPALTAAVLVQLAVNLRTPLRQTFPREFRAEHVGLMTRDGATEQWVYANHIYPTPDPIALPANHVVLARAEHPLQYLPYQYEGYTPVEREALRSTNISMRLVAIPPR